VHFLLSGPSSGVTYKDGALDWTLPILYYIHSGVVANSHSMTFTTPALSTSLGLLSFTIPLVPVSNSERSPSWLPEPSLCHNHSNPWLTVHSLELSPVPDSCCQSHITTDSELASPSLCQAPIWDPRPIFLSPWNFFRQVWVCYFVAPSLTREWVCNLLLPLLLVSAVPLVSDHLAAPIPEIMDASL
jgi:hypothetical protein